MSSRIRKIGGLVFLCATLPSYTLAQNLGSTSTAQIQNLQHTALKVGIISAGIGIGVMVISLALHHRHHKTQGANINSYKAAAASYSRSAQDAGQNFLKPSSQPAALTQLATNGRAASSTNLGLNTQAGYSTGLTPAENPR
jgi:hypothetical protein